MSAKIDLKTMNKYEADQQYHFERCAIRMIPLEDFNVQIIANYSKGLQITENRKNMNLPYSIRMY